MNIFRQALCVLLALAAGAAASQQSALPTDVQVITLGTAGGPRVRLKRSAPTNAIVIGSTAYVVDAGDRALQQLNAAKIKLDRVRALFVTHHHLDHTAGITPMLGIRWMTNITTPLKMYGPPGMKAIAEGLKTSIQPALAIGTAGKILDPLYNVDVHEVTGSGPVYQDENIRVFAAENTHFHFPVADPSKKPLSFAYRIETKQGVVVFTGDTGPSDAVTELARGADMLVSEVVNPDATIAEVRRNAPNLSPQAFANIRAHLVEDHIAPEAVGQMAAKAGVRQVVLTHLGPGLDSETTDDADALYAAGVRKHFGGPVKVANDLQVFTLPVR